MAIDDNKDGDVVMTLVVRFRSIALVLAAADCMLSKNARSSKDFARLREATAEVAQAIIANCYDADDRPPPPPGPRADPDLKTE